MTSAAAAFSFSMRRWVDALSTTRLIRLLTAANGSSLTRLMLEARPWMRNTLPSCMPPATSSWRDALARSADSSQLL
ncbi:Uncharacterised protein [Bordetella pertussis]|nr:Uncharacterised protein [Bordetella pertussis]